MNGAGMGNLAMQCCHVTHFVLLDIVGDPVICHQGEGGGDPSDHYSCFGTTISVELSYLWAKQQARAVSLASWKPETSEKEKST